MFFILMIGGIAVRVTRIPVLDYSSYSAALRGSVSGSALLRVSADHTRAIISVTLSTRPDGDLTVTVVSPPQADMTRRTIATVSQLPNGKGIDLPPGSIDSILNTTYAVEVRRGKTLLSSGRLIADHDRVDQTVDADGDAFFTAADIPLLVSNWLILYAGTAAREHTVSPPPHSTLVTSYELLDPDPDYDNTVYYPRSFKSGASFGSEKSSIHVGDAGKFSGADILVPRQDQSLDLGEWLRIRLARPARVSLAWISASPVPAWLASWQETGSVTVNGHAVPVYSTGVQNGDVYLGSDPRSGGIPFMALLTEQDGSVSPEPPVPAGKEAPHPNKPCPQWVHDQYQTKGPDGKTYASWHPQIDPVYWCYFGHEHGADPAVFDAGFQLPFGYAGASMGMHEAHPGFKVYVWDDMMGYRWMMLQHQGTSTNQAACGRFHELDLFVKNRLTGEILAKRFMTGDYGTSRVLSLGKPLTPGKCPDQGSIKTLGSRFLPVAGYGTTVEEPWVVDGKNVIGFALSDISVNALDSVRQCADIRCDEVVKTGRSGTQRVISYLPGFGPKADKGSQGDFYTDTEGRAVRQQTAMDGVTQYIKPGLILYSRLIRSPHFNLSTVCVDTHGFGGLYECGPELKAPPSSREHSVQSPN